MLLDGRDIGIPCTLADHIHADLRMALQIYSQAFDPDKRAAVDSLASLIGMAPTGGAHAAHGGRAS